MDTMKFGHYINAEGKREELEWNVGSQIITIRDGKVGTVKQLVCKHFVDFYEADEVRVLIERNKSIMDFQDTYIRYMFDLAEQELIRKSINVRDKNVFKYYPFFRLSQAWQISVNVGEYEFCEAGEKPDNTYLQLCDFDKSGAIVCDADGTPFDIKLNGAGKLVNVSIGRVLLPRKYGIRPTIYIFEED